MSRTSFWSATTDTGRFSGSSTRKRIVLRSGSSAPRQRRGRKGLIGVSARSLESSGRIGPLAERLYAVDPAGVATSTPSQTSSLIRTFSSTETSILAVWRVSRSSDTSLMAQNSCLLPSCRIASMHSGATAMLRARWIRPSSFSGERFLFIKKPIVPRFTP